MPEPAGAVLKRCEWNRYCGFLGPFYVEHLLDVGCGRPLLVGRCYSCGTYVCNRCALGRGPADSVAAGLRARELLCPLDGQPLGRGEEWVVFRGAIESAVRSIGPPSPQVLFRALAAAARTDTPEALAARKHLAAALACADAADYSQAVADCTRALETAPGSLLSRALRRRFLDAWEKPVEAWDDLRALFAASPQELAGALCEIEHLVAETSRRLDEDAKGLERLIVASRDGENLLPPDADAEADIRAWLELPLPTPPPALPKMPPQVPEHHAAHRFFDLRVGTPIYETRPVRIERTLVVLAHEHGVATQQENLYRQLEHVLALPVAVPVLLEGLAGARGAPLSAVSNRKRRLTQALQGIAREGLTATQALVRFYPQHPALRGADDAALLASQEKERAAVEGILGSSALLLGLAASGLDQSATALDRLSERVRGEKLRRFAELRAELHRDRKLTKYLSALEPFLREAPIRLDTYPSTCALLEALRIERGLDFNEVERQRLELVELLAALMDRPMPPDVLDALDGWCVQETPEEVALESLYRDLMTAAGRRPRIPSAGNLRGLFSRLLSRQPPEEPDVAPLWFAKLLVLSKALQEQHLSRAGYYARLDGLLAALKVHELGLVREYIRYVLLEEHCDPDTIVQHELLPLEAELREAMSQTAAERGVHQLLREKEVLRGLMHLSLPAARIRDVLEHGCSLRRWLREGGGLQAWVGGEASIEATWASLDPVFKSALVYDEALQHARRFYFHAARRSRKLFEECFSGALAHAALRVLVCGRFHLEWIVRAAAATPGLSLIVVAPFAEAGGKRRRAWELGEEHAGGPLLAR